MTALEGQCQLVTSADAIKEINLGQSIQAIIIYVVIITLFIVLYTVIIFCIGYKCGRHKIIVHEEVVQQEIVQKEKNDNDFSDLYVCTWCEGTKV